MLKNQQKIVLIGGPSSGKTSVLNALKEKGMCCFNEISRDIILKAREKGIDQLFLKEPFLFSKMLLEGREQQYLKAKETEENVVFFDRGIPDVFAYLNYFKTDFPDVFIEKSKRYKYDYVFHFSPWKEIHTTDNERYENFNEASSIDAFLLDAYKSLGYNITTIPFGSVNERANFIINSLACDL